MRIPLWVEASRLKVVVFGGGSVGTRRAKFFSSAGARVRVLAKEVSEELESSGIEIKRVDLNLYNPVEDIKWADLVVIAVNDERLAEKLFEIASSMGKLVNDATDASRTHVVVPYFKEVEGLKIATTSEGAAGAPARMALDVIETCIRNSWIPIFFKVYSIIKKEAKISINDIKNRLKFYQELVDDDEFMELVKSGDAEGALRRAREILTRFI